MASETTVYAGAAQSPASSNVRSVIVGAGIGNALEWYDFASYAISAPFFATQFFSPTDPTAALLSTLAIFAVGFLLRPIGGLSSGGWRTAEDDAMRWWCRCRLRRLAVS